MRALLKGIAETGSLDKLKKEIDDLHKCTGKQFLDESKKGFLKDGKFENDKYHSVYHTTKFVPPKPRESDVNAVAKTLIFLARYTTIFGKDYKFNNGQNFTSNEDVVFVGSLLLKLAKVVGGSLCPVRDSKEWKAKCTCKTDYCSNRGEAFSIVTALVDHNCDANGRTVYTDDVNVILCFDACKEK
ncbi:uncharacterized protein LOC116738462 [Nasonia vitripennis]|uniref:Uncharacterized protein n=1 Tax=Nasonia vitripennis TaxID=7425 RepID=A0A7M7QNT0_NASVI|nr:uncharacterized protein LOC116738462 [Nasonia vitripennis]